MRTIIQITGVEKFTSRLGKKFHRTYAMVDDGTDVIGFGKDFKLGDKVEVFFHKGTVKMRKPPMYY